MPTVRVPTKLGPLAVTIHGDQGPAVLLWHSLFVDGASWDAVVPALAPGRRLLVVDGPGHGASPGPGRRFTLDECADAAEELLDHQGLTAVDWIGNAWGGHVGVVLAARGTRIGKLAVISSPMQAVPAKARRTIVPLVVLFRVIGPAGFLVRKVTDVLLLPAARKARPELDAYLAAALRRPSRRALTLAMRSVMLGRPSLVERLPSVRSPTLFVATEDDETWPVELARSHAARLPDGRLATLGGSRHLPPLEVPAELSTLLVDWLAPPSG